MDPTPVLFGMPAPTVSPLGDVAKRALAHDLGEKHDRFKPAADTAEWILNYCVARGRGVPNLPWAVDKDDEAGWELEWRTLYQVAAAAMAGEDPDKVEELLLIKWLRANM